MADPTLGEIRRVREELIKRHGGLDGYLAYVQKLDRARRQRGRKASGKLARNLATKDTTPRARFGWPD
jgi:hypothetical protein